MTTFRLFLLLDKNFTYVSNVASYLHAGLVGFDKEKGIEMLLLSKRDVLVKPEVYHREDGLFSDVFLLGSILAPSLLDLGFPETLAEWQREMKENLIIAFVMGEEEGEQEYLFVSLHFLERVQREDPTEELFQEELKLEQERVFKLASDSGINPISTFIVENISAEVEVPSFNFPPPNPN